ncbi:MAG: hypothetical protein IPG56_01445 [Caulobacteraceae bacterium]|nr:hypothetical protein [Caulobacteraceae bacterium]
MMSPTRTAREPTRRTEREKFLAHDYLLSRSGRPIPHRIPRSRAPTNNPKKERAIVRILQNVVIANVVPAATRECVDAERRFGVFAHGGERLLHRLPALQSKGQPGSRRLIDIYAFADDPAVHGDVDDAIARKSAHARRAIVLKVRVVARCVARQVRDGHSHRKLAMSSSLAIWNGPRHPT